MRATPIPKPKVDWGWGSFFSNIKLPEIDMAPAPAPVYAGDNYIPQARPFWKTPAGIALIALGVIGIGAVVLRRKKRRA